MSLRRFFPENLLVVNRDRTNSDPNIRQTTARGSDKYRDPRRSKKVYISLPSEYAAWRQSYGNVVFSGKAVFFR
jgi:hypothetical protein